MRVFQIRTMYSGAEAVFARKFDGFVGMSNASAIQATIREGFDGCHILGPVLDQDSDVAFAWGGFEPLQRAWAREKGLPWSDPVAVTLAQIEKHRSEVIYCLDPLAFDSSFVRRLPGCVRHTHCWRAARRGGPDFSAYQIRLSNFPPINQAWEAEGLRAAYFSPSVDPTVGELPPPGGREVDVCFVGSVTRSHTERMPFLDAVATLGRRHKVHLHLLCSLPTWALSLPIIRNLPGNRFALPAALQEHSRPPLFGQNVFGALKRAKIVVNIALDTVGRPYRGNMRCFEAVRKIGQFLESGRWEEIGREGRDMISESYSKAAQWRASQSLVASL